jgi:hypothetical protein
MFVSVSIRLLAMTVLGLASLGQAFAEEDTARCIPCWYGGYDDYKASQGGESFCDNPGPGTTLDECELIHTTSAPAKDWWGDGCRTALEGGARTCPYKK